MSIFLKPFNPQERLYRSFVLGRPAIFSSQDINRYNDAIRYAIDETSNLLGGKRINWFAEFAAPTVLSYAAGDHTLEVSVAIDENVAGDNLAIIRGIAFNIPLVTLTETLVYTGTPADKKPTAYVCLVATKKRITFTDVVPVMHIADPKDYCSVSGENSSLVPFQLQGMDNEIYGDERLELVKSPNDVTLGVDEELIGILATVRWTTNFVDASSVFVQTGVSGYIIQHNFLDNVTDVTNRLKALLVDDGAGYTPILSQEQLETNGSLVEAFQLLVEHYIQGQSLQDKRLNANFDVLTSLTGSVSTLNADVLANTAAISSEAATRLFFDSELAARLNNIEGSWTSLNSASDFSWVSVTHLQPAHASNTFRVKVIGKTVHLYYRAFFDSVGTGTSVDCVAAGTNPLLGKSLAFPVFLQVPCYAYEPAIGSVSGYIRVTTSSGNIQLSFIKDSLSSSTAVVPALTGAPFHAIQFSGSITFEIL
jgi:hypothetical protein